MQPPLSLAPHTRLHSCPSPLSSIPTISCDAPTTATMAKQRNKSRTLKQQSSSRNLHTDTFPFTALPPEIRLKIYRLLLPHHLNIGFWPRPRHRSAIYSHVNPRHPLPRFSGTPFLPELFCFNPKIWAYPERLEPPFSSQIFSINREICEDARALLYGSNISTSPSLGPLTGTISVLKSTPLLSSPSSRAARHRQHVQLLIQEDFNRASKFRYIRKSIEGFVEALCHQHKLSSLNVEFSVVLFAAYP